MWFGALFGKGGGRRRAGKIAIGRVCVCVAFCECSTICKSQKRSCHGRYSCGIFIRHHVKQRRGAIGQSLMSMLVYSVREEQLANGLCRRSRSHSASCLLSRVGSSLDDFVTWLIKATSSRTQTLPAVPAAEET